jgi:cell wall-associated NlpC family hydrolase
MRNHSSHLPVYIMSEEKVGMYAMYMSTLGNKPDLFRGNPHASTLKQYVDYDIPEEVLEDPAFAALIAEAKKYLGYPYVWGGSKPSTSFDCSGFVSWVYTQTGVCNTGRLGATGLYGVCTPITPEEARPGDMVFFQGTINRADGITHVGIYVGNGMMIHCGNPITYADLSDRFWIDHFFGFGRPRTN